MKRYSLLLPLLALLTLLTLCPAQAQVTAAPAKMNFQGRLTKPDGTPVADGTYSVRFSLHDALTGGNEKWNQTLGSVTVRNGTFAALLDVNTANLFNGDLYLEVKIGNAAPLTPRQPLVSVPYALKANTVPDGSITADKLASGALNNLSWLLGGNAASAGQFLGTTNSQPLVFKTNNVERLRIDSGGGLFFPGSFGPNPNYVGFEGNFLSFGHPGASEDVLSYKNNTFFFKDAAGGGDTTDPNVVIGGNLGIGTDTPGAKLHVNGGIRVEGNHTFEFGGGITKQVDAGKIGYQTYSDALDIIGAGTEGGNRKIKFWNEGGAIFTGGASFTGTVQMTGFQMPTGAGANKVLVSDASGHGMWGNVSVDWSQIANIPGGLGGVSNTASGVYSLVAGGRNNIASGGDTTVAGGWNNKAIGGYSTVAGGRDNTANGSESATVGGGENNLASGNQSTVGGGLNNRAGGSRSFVGGGIGNTASGDYSTVAGGANNTASGERSFAAGIFANATHRGSFVWNDGSGIGSGNDAVFSSADYQFTIRAAGGTRIFSNFASTTGVQLAAGGGSWSSASDRNLKSNFQNVDTLDVLEKLVAMPLTTWNYKANTDIRHMGVMAQDFYKAFGGLGMDDKHIDTVDADGVAFAAIQGLNKKLEAQNAELKTEIADQKAKNAELEARLERLEAMLQRMQK